MASSPSPRSQRQSAASKANAEMPSNVCFPCHTGKRGCDKAVPYCSHCVQRNKADECYYIDLSLIGSDGIYNAISSANGIRGVAFRAVLDMFPKRQMVKHAIDAYFSGANTWFTIVDQPKFESQLESLWENPTPEMCALVLCMSLIATPPNVTTRVSRGNKEGTGTGNNPYHCAKAILVLVETNRTLTVEMLQAELLVALYELSHAMPREAYLTLNRCVHMAKACRWYTKAFWEGLGGNPRLKKLFSVLWWAIQYLDCLLHIGYDNPSYPMSTAAQPPDVVIPLPENINSRVPGSFGSPLGIGSSDYSQLDDLKMPLARSACFLWNVLQQPGEYSGMDSDATEMASRTNQMLSDRNPSNHAAVCTNLIALLKMWQPQWQPALLHGHNLDIPTSPLFPSDPDTAKLHAALTTTKTVISYICNEAALEITKSPSRLLTLSPSWAFAMYYAAVLLIQHGNAVLREANEADWFAKVGGLKQALEMVGRRWRIGGWYAERIGAMLGQTQTQRAGDFGVGVGERSRSFAR